MTNAETKDIETSNIHNDAFIMSVAQRLNLTNDYLKQILSGTWCLFCGDTTLQFSAVARDLWDLKIMQDDKEDIEKENVSSEQLERIIYNFSQASNQEPNDEVEQEIHLGETDTSAVQPQTTGSKPPLKFASDYEPQQKPTGSLQKENVIATRFIGTAFTNDLLKKLQDVLPTDLNTFVDDAGKVIVQGDFYEVKITSKGANFYDLEVWTPNGRLQKHTQKALGFIVAFTFNFCTSVEKLDDLQKQIKTFANRETTEEDATEEDITQDDIYETLKEYAVATGQTDDILKNRDLFSLRAGLTTNQQQPINESVSRLQKLAGIKPNSTPQHLRGATTFKNAPISLNENRDLSRPYNDTTNNRKLIYVYPNGAIWVDKDQLPKQKVLGYTTEDGVVLTDEPQPKHKNLWKPFWQRNW